MSSDIEKIYIPLHLKKLFAWAHRRKWRLLILSALCFVAYGWLSSVIWYSSEISGRVVTPNGQPIADAIVVANWERRNWLHGAPQGQLAVLEVVTDKNGEFRIPEWGPLFLPQSYGSYQRSTIRIYHPKFVPLVAFDFDQRQSANLDEISKETLRKQPLVLVPFHSSLAEYESTLTALTQSLFYINYDKEPCGWKSIPRLAVALDIIKTALAQEGRGDTIPSFYKKALANQDLCGDAEKFFQDYKKNE
jgi:hypothetical protein